MSLHKCSVGNITPGPYKPLHRVQGWEPLYFSWPHLPWQCGGSRGQARNLSKVTRLENAPPSPPWSQTWTHTCLCSFHMAGSGKLLRSSETSHQWRLIECFRVSDLTASGHHILRTGGQYPGLTQPDWSGAFDSMVTASSFKHFLPGFLGYPCPDSHPLSLETSCHLCWLIVARPSSCGEPEGLALGPSSCP